MAIEQEIYNVEQSELNLDSEIDKLESLDFDISKDVDSEIDKIQKQETNLDSEIDKLESLSF